jgi:hypothetical protein
MKCTYKKQHQQKPGYLHTTQSINNLYINNELSTLSVIKRFKGNCHRFKLMYTKESPARMGEARNAYRILVGKPEGKRPLGRPRSRWVDNIKLDLRER